MTLQEINAKLLGRFKIGQRLGGGFALVIVLTLIMGGIALNAMGTLSELTVKLYRHPLTVSNAVLQVNADIIAIHRHMKDVVLANDAAGVAKAIDKVDGYEVKVFKGFEIIEERFLGDKSQINEAKQSIVDWKPIRDEVIALISEGRRDEASAITTGKGATQVALVERHTNGLIEFARNKASEFLASSEATGESTTIMMIGLLIGIVSMASAVAFFITRGITGPLGLLHRSMATLASGDNSVEIPATDRKDEIGEMAKAVLVFKENGVENERLATEARENEEKLTVLNEELSLERDRAEAANRAKSEFLAAMSHELRTPLNAVIGFSEIISSQAFGPVGHEKYSEYAEDIRGAGKHLLDLINDILDLAKVEAGSEELHEENIDIEELSRSVLSLVKGRATQQEVQFELDIQEDLPLVYADLRRLKQILVNLITNSIKFNNPGGKVTLKVWHSKDGFVFQIIDTGIGMAEENIAKALSRFGQVDRNIHRSQEGTGLGLPLTKALVELHGGSLDLQSRLEVGTTVTVRFPSVRTIEG